MNEGPPRFDKLLEVIVRAAGGCERLARETGVPKTTLRSWQRGHYPRHRLTVQVEEVEAWARKNLGSDYPPAGFPAGGLPGCITRTIDTSAHAPVIATPKIFPPPGIPTMIGSPIPATLMSYRSNSPVDGSSVFSRSQW